MSSYACAFYLQGNPLTTIGAGSLPSGVSGIDFSNDPISTIDPAAFDGSSNTLGQLSFSKARFTTIPTALTHLNKLQVLSIQDTAISKWDIDVIKHIGLTLTDLTLDNVSLASWPDWIQYMPRLQVLEMTSSFTTIPNNAFDTLANVLPTLRLTNGILSEIPLVISKLSALTTLVLDYNKISRISGLPSFGNLWSLSIQYNNVSNATHLSDALRSVADSLSYLEAEGNKLTSFPDLSFMTKLQTVYLSHNRISDTDSGSISSSVTYLELMNNNIRSLAGFLTGGINLNYLGVGMNLITSISGSNIPANLTEFDVSSNLISELTDTSFPTNTKIDILTLDYNPISAISSASFASLSALGALSLIGTKLTRLPLALSSLTGLYSLDMSHSPNLVCTCLEKSLRSWYVGRSLASFGDCGPTSIDYFFTTLSAGCP